MRLRIRQALDAAIVTAYQAHARRRERVAIKAAMREVPPEEFGECRLCGFTHSWPLERTVCEVCGGLVCRGEPVCACGDGGGIRCYAGPTENAPATRERPGARPTAQGG
jgi:hypothetical protein